MGGVALSQSLIRNPWGGVVAAPNVKLDGGVYSSLRMAQLGAALGTSIYDAVGRMGHLWQTCTERQTAVLPELLVRTIVDPDLVVSADLGERVDGGIRIKGTTGRIEWYGKLQESGKKGAAKRWKANPRKTNRVAIGSPSGTDGQPVVREIDIDPEVGSSSGSENGKGVRGKPEAGELADCLREHLLAEKPDHDVGDASGWTARRAAWVRGFSALLRKGRTPERVREVMAWLFGDQGGTEFRFVVESPSSLAEKWDRIEKAMARKSTAITRAGPRAAASAADLWAEAERLEAEGR